MKRKDYLVLMGWAYALLVVGLVILFVYMGSEIDSFGLIFGVCTLAFFSYKSYTSFKALKVVREEDIAYAPTTDATVQEQIAYFKKILILSSIAFPILSIWIWLDLNSLESGEVDSVSIWGPVAFLYDIGGYWVAILTVPILGVFVLGSLLKKVSDLKKQK